MAEGSLDPMSISKFPVSSKEMLCQASTAATFQVCIPSFIVVIFSVLQNDLCEQCHWNEGIQHRMLIHLLLKHLAKLQTFGLLWITWQRWLYLLVSWPAGRCWYRVRTPWDLTTDRRATYAALQEHRHTNSKHECLVNLALIEFNSAFNSWLKSLLSMACLPPYSLVLGLQWMSLMGPSVFRDCSSKGKPSGSIPCLERVHAQNYYVRCSILFFWDHTNIK